MRIEKGKLCGLISIGALLIFFLAYHFKFAPLSLVGLGILVCMIPFFDAYELFVSFAFLLPNTYLVKIIGSNAALLGYWLLLFLIVYYLRMKTVAFDKKLVWVVIAHLASVMISIFLTGNTSIVSAIIRFIAFLLILNVLKNMDCVPYGELVKAFVNGCIWAVALSLVYNVLHGINSFAGGFRSLGNDRNYFAITIAFALTAYVVYMYNERKAEVVDFIKIFILYIAGILSSSRTFIIISLMSVFAIILMSNRLSKTRKFMTIAILMVLVVAGLIFFGDQIQLVLDRFGDDNMAGGNGRFEAWNVYLGQAFSSLRTALFGFGDSTEYRLIFGLDAVEHNTAVQALFTIGIIGTLTLGILIFFMYRSYADTRKYRKKTIIHFLPLASICIGYLTVNGLYSSNLLLAIVLSFVLMCSPESENYVCEEMEE